MRRVWSSVAMLGLTFLAAGAAAQTPAAAQQPPPLTNLQVYVSIAP